MRSFLQRQTDASLCHLVSLRKTDRIRTCPWALLTHGHRGDEMVLHFPKLEQLPLGCHHLMGLNCLNPFQGQNRGLLPSLFLKLCFIRDHCVGRQGKVLSRFSRMISNIGTSEYCQGALKLGHQTSYLHAVVGVETEYGVR